MLIDVALLRDLDDGLPRETPPDILWHYTSVASAKAILASTTVSRAARVRERVRAGVRI